MLADIKYRLHLYNITIFSREYSLPLRFRAGTNTMGVTMVTIKANFYPWFMANIAEIPGSIHTKQKLAERSIFPLFKDDEKW